MRTNPVVMLADQQTTVSVYKALQDAKVGALSRVLCRAEWGDRLRSHLTDREPQLVIIVSLNGAEGYDKMMEFILSINPGAIPVIVEPTQTGVTKTPQKNQGILKRGNALFVDQLDHLIHLPRMVIEFLGGATDATKLSNCCSQAAAV